MILGGTRGKEMKRSVSDRQVADSIPIRGLAESSVDDDVGVGGLDPFDNLNFSEHSL